MLNIYINWLLNIGINVNAYSKGFELNCISHISTGFELCKIRVKFSQ